VTGCYTSEAGRAQQYYSGYRLKRVETQLHPFSFETGWWLVNAKQVLADFVPQEHYSRRVYCRKTASPVCYHRKATNKPLPGGFFVPKIRLVSLLHHA
jgi:hypothetical protein